MNPTSIHEDVGLIPGLTHRVKDPALLWSKTWLGSRVAVAVAYVSGYSSDLTPSLGTSICHKCGPPKKPEQTKKYLKTNNENTTIQNLWDTAKAVIKRKFIVIQAFLKKVKISNQGP